MKRLRTCADILKNWVFLVLFFAIVGSNNTQADELTDGPWRRVNGEQWRPHSVSILEFGAVGDGNTLNTLAFQNAIFYLRSFADKGGAQLYVPQGRWLTGSFNLISHLTLFLEKNAVIIGSQDPLAWPVIEPLPSYGQGQDLPGRRHRSLISGYGLTDVVITGQNGSIDGQGAVWWDWLVSRSLNYSRPHLIELQNCSDVTISNLTLLNSPAWHVHPVYSSNVRIHNMTIRSPPDVSSTSGIVPDSSSGVWVEDCAITVGGDAIALKSGWDRFGLAVSRPVSRVRVRRVKLRATVGSGLVIGSEMSGGANDVRAEDVIVVDSAAGISLETTRGRGGHVEDVVVSRVSLINVDTAIRFSGQCGAHPDGGFDPGAIPAVRRVTLEKMDGDGICMAGNLTGVDGDHPFEEICLSDINLSVSSNVPWVCSHVVGSSQSVFPEPCPELQIQNSSSSVVCFSSPGPSIPTFDQ
ncbi:putative polygalacturonase [Wolffia australiana]